jgi:hypothetical protein
MKFGRAPATKIIFFNAREERFEKNENLKAAQDTIFFQSFQIHNIYLTLPCCCATHSNNDI